MPDSPADCASPADWPFLDRRFVLVTGKGGVGKSTVTALLARLYAQAGKRTLVCELNTQERIPGLFGHDDVGGTVTPIAENLWSVNIDPAQAMEEYGVMKLRFRALYRVVFNNPLVQRLVRFVPGMNDLLMFGKAFNHERETDSAGRPAWDAIIVDAPATGHGISFFRLPRIIRDAVPAGNLHREAEEMWSLMSDPARTVVHLVTLPEELPVRETQELHQRLRHELGVPLGSLFLNMWPPPALDAAQQAHFERLTARPTDPALALLWATTRIRLGREHLASHYLQELEALGLPLVKLPTLYTTDFGPAEVDALARTACTQEPPP
ncbi:MAG: ArsA family ATPase [Myxococcales bacterium]|nr:ArsA family ATPase [Myxococcales bacterium]MCB9522639.1 ArsA family ATPase [Myxococcales bacterium]